MSERSLMHPKLSMYKTNIIFSPLPAWTSYDPCCNSRNRHPSNHPLRRILPRLSIPRAGQFRLFRTYTWSTSSLLHSTLPLDKDSSSFSHFSTLENIYSLCSDLEQPSIDKQLVNQGLQTLEKPT